MGKRKAVMMDCDNPRCNVSNEHTSMDPAPGYHLGKGAWHDFGGGGPIPAVYAHSKACIQPAVEAVIDISLGYDPLTGDRLD